jgi:hypothetical protein
VTGVSEPTEVEAHFSVEGEITPRSFIWRGSKLVIEGVGRCWQEEGVRCFAILAAGGRPFELRLDEEVLCWYVARSRVPRTVV